MILDKQYTYAENKNIYVLLTIYKNKLKWIKCLNIKTESMTDYKKTGETLKILD